jgi:tetratricopeptide (TPR) repeat protein
MNVMEEKGYKEDWHTVLYEFSKLLSRKGDFERAEIYIEEALRFSIYNNAKGLVGHIFTTKAINYERQGMLEKAQEIWNKALEYTEKENLDFQKAMILHNMGNFSLMYKGELLKAFELYKGSLKIYEKYNTDFEILLNRCLLALIKLIKGEDVKQEFKEIIKLSKELKIIPLKNLALWGYSFYDIEFIEDFRKDPFFSVFFTSSKEEFKKNLLSLIELQRVNRLRLFLWGSIKIIPALEQEFKRIYIHVVKEKKLHPFYLKNIPFTIH